MGRPVAASVTLETSGKSPIFDSARQISLSGHVVSAVLLAAAFWLFAFSAPLQAAPDSGNQITRVSLGEADGFSRLAFTFERPLDYYVIRRDDVNRVVVDFGPMRLGKPPEMPFNELVTMVELTMVEGRLTAKVTLSVNRYELRHFASRDRYSCVLDFRKTEEESGALPPESADMKPITIPLLADEAALLSLMIPPAPTGEAARNLFLRSLSYLQAGSIPEAQADFDLFLRKFPDHPVAEFVTYLKAETSFFAGPPADTYSESVKIWQDALNKWPQSVMAPRAQFLLAEADRLAGQLNEAAAKFKLIAADAPNKDDIYTQLALLRAADLLMGLGLISEARNTLDPALQEGVSDRLALEAYARVGMADFFQGFFSQANEIFRDVLKLAPQVYLTYPEMLYAAGEGYHYLNRPDLSRLFLLHALNLMPDHPKADVIMARIGDNYRKEGRDREAIAVYGAAKRHFPDGDGGMISQVRLAEMGALHSFFTQDKVFDALERGSRQATVEMYKTIVETGSASPLIQLAQLKIGVALAEDGESSEAVKWLRDLEMNDPRSTLLPEALPALNRALMNEFALRNELNDYRGLADLYADNSSYLSNEDRPAVQHMVANAYEKIGLYSDARKIWQEIEDQSPEKRLERAKALVLNSLKIGQPLEAMEYLAEMEKEFPRESDWMAPYLTEVGNELAKPRNAQATDNLLKLRETVTGEPARREALVDAIEIEINDRRYDKASALMSQYRQEYPYDALTPEYLLTQAQIEDYQKRYDNAWDFLSEFRLNYPDDPRLPSLLLDQVERADNLGRPDDVFRFIELYRGRFPNNPESRAMLEAKIDRQWEMGRYDDSLDSLRAFRRDYPGDPNIPDLIIKQSSRDWENGLYDEAARLTQDLLLNYPDDPRTVRYLIAASDRDWDKERYDEAQAVTQTLVQHFPQDSLVVEHLLKRADDDWGRGRLDQARAAWALFRQAFPDDLRVGRSYLNEYKRASASGMNEEAFRLADEFRRLRPQDTAGQADLLLEEAKDYLALGRTAEGLDAWNRFRVDFPDDPRNPDLLLIQARQELKLGRSQEALDHYRQFIGQYPGNLLTPDVYLETAAAETRLGRNQEAWDHLDRYRNLFPSHSGRERAFLDQASLGQTLGLLDDTINLYRQFRDDYSYSDSMPATYLAQARLEIAAGRPLSAVETLEAGILSSPQLNNDPQVQALLTDLYLETGRIEDWAAIVEKNLDRAERSTSDLNDRFLKYNQLAQVYQELNSPEDAERNYDSALANRPPSAPTETIYAVATAYKKLQRPEKYAAALVLVRDSGDPFWQRIAEEELKTIQVPAN